VVPQYMQVPPSMPLSDAAWIMCRAAEPGRTCHHLVVRAVTGGRLGVFSALDVTRALHGLPTELDVAKAGADGTTVDAVMKLVAAVPRCKPEDTIREALGTLDLFCQNASLVVDGDDVLGLITPRCALQALAAGVPRDLSVGAWMRTRHTPDVPREVPRGTSIKEAAAIMTTHSLHHLLVVDLPSTKPVGVLSALDLARAVVSMNYHCPFVSLGWLRRMNVPTSFSLLAPTDALKGSSSRKRPAMGLAADAPDGSRPRVGASASNEGGATGGEGHSDSSSSGSGVVDDDLTEGFIVKGSSDEGVGTGLLRPL